MKIAIASDHRGFAAKERVKTMLVHDGHQVTDYGCNGTEGCDYPDLAVPAAVSVADGENESGILICGTGLGMSIAANKIAGIRAALCHDELTAEMARKHNDANVLCLAGDLLGEQLVRIVVEKWLSTKFEGGRHQRRLDKIARIECHPSGE